jgi:hypothetical protein
MMLYRMSDYTHRALATGLWACARHTPRHGGLTPSLLYCPASVPVARAQYAGCPVAYGAGLSAYGQCQLACTNVADLSQLLKTPRYTWCQKDTRAAVAVQPCSRRSIRIVGRHATALHYAGWCWAALRRMCLLLLQRQLPGFCAGLYQTLQVCSSTRSV